MIFGFASQGVKFGTELGTEPSKMWFSMLLMNLATNLTIFKTRVIVSLDLSSSYYSPNWSKNLQVETKPYAMYLEKYKAAGQPCLGRCCAT
jgi:hypothetical protein